MIAYELTRGLAYRRIRHAELHWYTRTIPLALTVLGAGTVLWLPVAPVILGSNGLLASSLSVMSTLPGFYFAGLAAVATFAGLNMDAVMPSPAPTIAVKVGATSQIIELSRRQFLSYLFSYLVMVSLGLCVAAVIANMAAPSLLHLKAQLAVTDGGRLVWAGVRASAIVVYTAGVASVVVTTLHGMFFLTERIHQP